MTKKKEKQEKRRMGFRELFNVDFPPTVDCIVEARGEQVHDNSENCFRVWRVKKVRRKGEKQYV